MFAIAVAIVATASCAGKAPASPPSTGELRIGVGQQAAVTGPQGGLREIEGNLSIESLFSFTGDDGRPGPALAERWTVAADGRSVAIRLRPNVWFHDRDPLRAETVASILRQSLEKTMGPARADFASVEAQGPLDLVVRFNAPSPFLLEALEAPIAKADKPGTGTGPYQASPPGSGTLIANARYYLGPPALAAIHVSTYPSVRAAWADLLRDRIDMLYEVGVDALDSLTSSTSVSVYTFTRRYQHLVLLNPERPVLRSAALRRALNLAIDRAEFAHVALNDHALTSSGAVWPRHWAAAPNASAASDAKEAASLAARTGSKPHFTCLVAPEPMYERMALEVRRQLAAIGVDMTVEQATMDNIEKALYSRQFDAALVDMISGPTLFRTYQLWHSNGSRNPTGLSTPERDAALDRIERAASDAEYRSAVAAFQRVMADDPPAIFLVWSQRARAVSRRFDVPAEPGRDVLATLRLWKPVTDARAARRN